MLSTAWDLRNELKIWGPEGVHFRCNPYVFSMSLYSVSSHSREFRALSGLGTADMVNGQLEKWGQRRLIRKEAGEGSADRYERREEEKEGERQGGREGW